MKTVVLLVLLALGASADTLRIAVAANVSYAIASLKAAFAKTHPGTDVDVILGSSGKLTAQIINGAPYDLFMAANMKYPQKVYDEGYAVTTPKIYAQGQLVLFSTKKLPMAKGIALAADSAVKRIAVANYKLAPYGKAAVEALGNAGLMAVAEPKFINGESVTQAVQYTMVAADIGFIPKSALYSEKMLHYKENGNWIEVDPKLYTPIDQGAALLKHGESSKSAKAFYDFLFTPEAEAVFKAYGYRVP